MSKKFELKHRRSLNSKVFYNGDGTFTLRAHVGHIHYKDKQTREFEDIDPTLIPTENGWEMRKSNYEAEIPKYADGEFKFIHSCLIDINTKKDLELPEECISFIPLGVSHVDGRLDEGKRKVTYPNAFGDGIDLEIETGKLSLRKYIVIRKQPEELTKDLEFSFVVSLPHMDAKVKWKDRETGKFVEWRKDKDVEILGDVPLTLGKNRETWIRPLRIWDSAGNKAYIKVKLRIINNKPVLTKILPKDFLLKATYPVYTDTTTSYYSGSGDGYVENSNSNWNICHDATSGSDSDYIYAATFISSHVESSNYVIRRAFFPIDTSSIPDNAEIQSATFHFDIYSIDQKKGTNYFALVQTSQASVTSLTNDDFDQCGAVNNPTEGADRLQVPSSTGWYSFSLNSTGLGWINKTGYTKLGIRSGDLDCDDVAPTDGSHEFCVQVYTSESSYDPYLEVTYGFFGDVTLAMSQSQSQESLATFQGDISLSHCLSQQQNGLISFFASISLDHAMSQAQDRVKISLVNLPLSHSLSQTQSGLAQSQSQVGLSHSLSQAQSGLAQAKSQISLSHSLSQLQSSIKLVQRQIGLSHSLSQSQTALSYALAGYMASYLSQKTPDYDAFLPNLPVSSFSESVTVTTNILEVDSGDEERIQISQPDFRVTLNLSKLTRSQIEELIEFYTNETKANGKMRSFKWTHPVDGHTYVVRFDTDLIDVVRHGLFTDELSITLRVLGYSSLGWS